MEKTSKNIILIGFMGSGKTSVGLKLSYKLRRALVNMILHATLPALAVNPPPLTNIIGL